LDYLTTGIKSSGYATGANVLLWIANRLQPFPHRSLRFLSPDVPPTMSWTPCAVQIGYGYGKYILPTGNEICWTWQYDNKCTLHIVDYSRLIIVKGQNFKQLYICRESAYGNSGSIQNRSVVSRFQIQTFLLHDFAYSVIFCRNTHILGLICIYFIY
jgi:hypothetical protein